MGLLLFVLLPLGWAITGRLLGTVVSLTVATEGGRRVGGVLGRHCAWLLPLLYFAVFLAGASGNAGDGVRLFGSEQLFGLLCLPMYSVPVLAAYAIGVHVIRDLFQGFSSRSA